MTEIASPEAFRRKSPVNPAVAIKLPSFGSSNNVPEIVRTLSRFIDKWEVEPANLRIPHLNVGADNSFALLRPSVSDPAGGLYNSLAFFKLYTASIAMHLDQPWRAGLFRQLDNLLSADEWDAEDEPPTNGSLQTFLRMLLLLKPERRPGVGATGDGHMIATWTSGEDRLTIECLPDDRVRWMLSIRSDFDGESASATNDLSRLPGALQHYDPKRWFNAAA